MTIQTFNLNIAHPSWHDCLKNALQQMDQAYLNTLFHSTHWLPGPEKIFNAFSLPVEKVKYLLFGESPYPRAASANGYAFWDAAVTNLWSETGLSKPVNRATSLRNIMKMLLVSEGLLDPKHTSQPHIAEIDKSRLIATNQELFNQLLDNGFLLLNATLVLQPGQVRKDAVAWHPFIKQVLTYLCEKCPDTQLILFGNIANIIDKLAGHHCPKKLYSEHPYNLSFISNQQVIEFFKPLHLLMKP